MRNPPHQPPFVPLSLSASSGEITSRRIEELVDEAQTKKQKFICFVTGVPWKPLSKLGDTPA
jgi:hypothetical protein